jgi:hypothetical protein
VIRGAREPLRRLVAVRAARRRRGDAEPEVQDLDVAALRQPDARRTQVAVQHAALVLRRARLQHRVQRRGDLGADLEGGANRKPAVPNDVIEAHPASELGDERGVPADLQHAVDVNDRAVADRADAAQLVLQLVRRAALGLRQEVDRHRLDEPAVADEIRSIDDAVVPFAHQHPVQDVAAPFGAALSVYLLHGTLLLGPAHGNSRAQFGARAAAAG